MVPARSGIGITRVDFASAGGTDFTPSPKGGVENIVRISVAGEVNRVQAAVVNATSKVVATLPLTAGDAPGMYLSRFTPPTGGFRIQITGLTTDGPFVRVHAPLYTVR
jgi:hypothetical protein